MSAVEIAVAVVYSNMLLLAVLWLRKPWHAAALICHKASDDLLLRDKSISAVLAKHGAEAEEMRERTQRVRRGNTGANAKGAKVAQKSQKEYRDCFKKP